MDTAYCGRKFSVTRELNGRIRRLQSNTAPYSKKTPVSKAVEINSEPFVTMWKYLQGRVMLILESRCFRP
jgi:hypothetical protein